MASSITHAPSANETHDTPADNKDFALAEEMGFAPAYLAGYFGASIEGALTRHPNDPDLLRAAALYRAWRDRAYNTRATIAGGAA